MGASRPCVYIHKLPGVLGEGQGMTEICPSGARAHVRSIFEKGVCMYWTKNLGIVGSAKLECMAAGGSKHYACGDGCCCLVQVLGVLQACACCR